jgi:hypothetical protein
LPGKSAITASLFDAHWTLDRMLSYLEEEDEAEEDAPVPPEVKERWERNQRRVWERQTAAGEGREPRPQ